VFKGGGSGLHLHSFVTTTKPKSSLFHNLKSVQLTLTGNIVAQTATPVWKQATAGYLGTIFELQLRETLGRRLIERVII
jgi:hypothetical protein